MKKLLFIAIVLSAASFVIASDSFSVRECNGCEIDGKASKNEWYWKCPNCRTINRQSTRYCDGCGIIQR